MVKEELKAVMREIMMVVAPSLKGNPLASLMLTHLEGYLNSLQETQAQEIAKMIVRYSKRLEAALERERVG